MTTIPERIPGAVQTWKQRVEARRTARRTYVDLLGRLEDKLAALPFVGDCDDRAALLDTAAGLTDRLAALHTTAWGRDLDADGRSAAVCLCGQAVLLRQVAATERAVIGTLVWAATPLARTEPRTAAELGELRDWAVLAHTAAPDLRAVYLRRLHARVAAYLGARTAAVLARLAEGEQQRADRTRPAPLSRWWLHGPRVVIGVFFVALAAIIAVPGLGTGTRDLLGLALLCVYAAALGGWRLVTARRPCERDRARTRTREGRTGGAR